MDHWGPFLSKPPQRICSEHFWGYKVTRFQNICPGEIQTALFQNISVWLPFFPFTQVYIELTPALLHCDEEMHGEKLGDFVFFITLPSSIFSKQSCTLSAVQFRQDLMLGGKMNVVFWNYRCRCFGVPSSYTPRLVSPISSLHKDKHIMALCITLINVLLWKMVCITMGDNI